MFIQGDHFQASAKKWFSDDRQGEIEAIKGLIREAIDAGADLVMGHGPHYSLPVELYKGKPVFYGLGSFSFHTGHGKRKHGDWVGMLARVVVDDGKVSEAAFRLVRHNEANETYFCDPAKESAALEQITSRSKAYGTRFSISGDEVVIGL